MHTTYETLNSSSKTPWDYVQADADQFQKQADDCKDRGVIDYVHEHFCSTDKDHCMLNMYANIQWWEGIVRGLEIAASQFGIDDKQVIRAFAEIRNGEEG